MFATLRMLDGGERVVQRGSRLDDKTVVIAVSEAGVTVARDGVTRSLSLDAIGPLSPTGSGAMTPGIPPGALPTGALPPGVAPPAMLAPRG